MKILIASDIHGSELHCCKLVKACYQERVETLLLLGDILDGNKEVAVMLNSLSREKTILCVRGNCDYPRRSDDAGLPDNGRVLFIVRTR